MKLVPTASQTVGPFFLIGCHHLCVREPSVDAGLVTVHGRVLDGNREPVPDAMLELWYADGEGRYAAASDGAGSDGQAAGFARVFADDAGCFNFTIHRPGAVPFDSRHMQAPHIEVLVFARGLLRQLFTRMYFPDEANTADPVLGALPADRRATLIAQSASPAAEALEWNIVLQGEDETIFFAW